MDPDEIYRWSDLRAALTECQQQRDALAEALRKTQWGIRGDCSVCFASRYEGHTEDCEVGKSLVVLEDDNG